MSMDETDRTAPAADSATPLLQTLGDPDAAVCVDGFCEVPGTAAEPVQTTNPSGADT
jgi:hypothetical protein